jgi:hypothetical protein
MEWGGRGKGKGLEEYMTKEERYPHHIWPPLSGSSLNIFLRYGIWRYDGDLHFGEVREKLGDVFVEAGYEEGVEAVDNMIYLV